MGFFGKSKEEKIAEFKGKQSMRNGKELKKILTAFKEDRDEIEKRTGKRPDIDDTTKMFMQKVLNVWMSEGKDIDDEKFCNAGDYKRQITNSLIFRLNITKENPGNPNSRIENLCLY